jgi:hypothetical protein
MKPNDTNNDSEMSRSKVNKSALYINTRNHQTRYQKTNDLNESFKNNIKIQSKIPYSFSNHLSSQTDDEDDGTSDEQQSINHQNSINYCFNNNDSRLIEETGNSNTLITMVNIILNYLYININEPQYSIHDKY